MVSGLVDPPLQRFDEQLATLHEGWTEGRLFGGEAQQVCRDPHLAVAVVTCPDADHRDGQRLLCLLYTSPSPRDLSTSRMPSSA